MGPSARPGPALLAGRSPPPRTARDQGGSPAIGLPNRPFDASFPPANEQRTGRGKQAATCGGSCSRTPKRLDMPCHASAPFKGGMTGAEEGLQRPTATRPDVKKNPRPGAAAPVPMCRDALFARSSGCSAQSCSTNPLRHPQGPVAIQRSTVDCGLEPGHATARNGARGPG
ncbi:hypothetical protein K491DRAFT_109134 [Lophiostoma macrostomum CBS 122681]|uniref:Uncharacterized protein n=1 Tax=Lophiostoma macrostomum CBS 122681 TaxID=1314788 RepID=A0A6A6TMB1_9PLEO|nr:hypothetical protein K491DRAFT_109134 [Lophiostoma macrostomum CBS 122681]